MTVRMLLRAPKQLLDAWLRHYQIQRHHPSLVLAFPVALQYDTPNAFDIGRDVVIGAFSEICVHRRSPYSAVPGGLHIGDRTIIGTHANLRAAGGEIWIGADCAIAQGVSLIASSHQIEPDQIYHDQPWDETKTGVYLGNNVWLGAGVTVLPGCRLGANAVVGAGSVVTRNIPANEVWAGVPARRLRRIEAREAEVQTSPVPLPNSRSSYL